MTHACLHDSLSPVAASLLFRFSCDGVVEMVVSGMRKY